jgi:exopolysaccharide biosynthesis protein
MKQFFNKSSWWAIICTMLLMGFTVFVLLDTFVIPKAIATMPDVHNTQTDNVTISSVDNTQSDNATISGVDNTQNDDATVATGGAVYTTNSYEDENIRITITTERMYDTQVYIADIQIQSVDYLKTAFAQNTFGRNIYQTTSAMAEAHNAIFAINGDQCGYFNKGFVVRNGILYRSSSGGNEALVIYEDGSFGVVSESTTSADALLEQGAVQVFSFGPSLLCKGEINVAVDNTRNPRTAIGVISALHYVVIVADGRSNVSAGITLYQLAAILKEQGCETAYNVDGGGSSTMWFNGEIVNVPTDGRTLGQRKVSDIVYVGY